MSKWKCEICNSEFDNFQAQGFNNKIYCPLCYYKKLYKTTELERKRLNNIINELEKELDLNLKFKVIGVKRLKDKLNSLKEGEQ